MASTVGHALCGIDCLMLGRLAAPRLVPRLSLPLVMAAMFLANAPDLDLLVGPLIGEHHHYFHGQVTHSVMFALLAGLVCWLVGKMRRFDADRNLFFAALVSVGLASHVLVDWFTGPLPGWNPSFGIWLWWPIVNERVHAPLTLFLGPHHGSMDVFLSLHNVWVMVRELIIFGGIGFALWMISTDLREQIKSLFGNMLKGNFR